MPHQKNISSFVISILLLVAVISSLAACDSQEGTATVVAERPFSTPTPAPSHTPSPLPTATPSHTPTITPSHTPTHTPTATPTTTPFPTVTAPPKVETKTVFLQYGGFGGDGGHYTDLYYGRGMPNLVIYTDGQVIRQEHEDTYSSYFLETAISSDEMCYLLGQLQSYSFFEEYDPLYAFDETTQYSDGAGEAVIEVNGPLAKSLYAYSPYVFYLVPPLKQSYDLIHNYRPFSDTYYLPKQLVLWIEADQLPEGRTAIPWPDTLPAIEELWHDSLNGELVIEGELILPLMELFNYRMTSNWFSNKGQIYKIILRPLLPHENPFPQLQYYSYNHNQPPSNLPFDCPTLTLPTVAPTLTPSPLPILTIEPITELTGNGRILFTSQRDGNAEIYVMNANGTNLSRLTNHPATDKMATWSPDGQTIAFVSDRDGNEEVYLMNADGTDVTRLTDNPAIDEQPHWSSDGQHIAFLSNRNATSYGDNLREIYVIRVDGTGEERNTFLSENISSFSWSSDGQSFAFAFGAANEEQIYIKGLASFSRTLFTEGFSPNWSPNSQQIAFGLDNQIYLKDLSSEDTTQLTDGDHIIGLPVWSPDGSYVAFNRSINYQLEIFVISLETRQETRLTFSFGDDIITDWRS